MSLGSLEKSLLKPSAVKNRKQVELSHFWRGYRMIQPLWQTVWYFLIKVNINLPGNQAVPLIAVYPRDTKIDVTTKT